MNSRTLERLLLLEQSGELSPRQQRQLNAELARSVEARQQRNTLHTLVGDIPAVETEPAADAAARITARLRETPAPAPAPRSLFRPLWKPALAAAAALALLLGVRSFQTPVTRETDVVQVIVEELWADPFEADFIELDTLIAAINLDDWEDGDDSIDLIEL